MLNCFVCLGHVCVLCLVGMVCDDTLAVRPTKIVAGHEPEKTNEFLQLMGKAVLSKVCAVLINQKNKRENPFQWPTVVRLNIV